MMNAEAIRHFYGYHVAENRVLWERYVEHLTSDQFTLPLAYAHGSVRDQILHLMGGSRHGVAVSGRAGGC
jgi:uncharacterized damage-inducible protein DinB